MDFDRIFGFSTKSEFWRTFVYEKNNKKYLGRAKLVKILYLKISFLLLGIFNHRFNLS